MRSSLTADAVCHLSPIAKLARSPVEESPHIGRADPRWFGTRNLVLTGANTYHHVPRFAGPISIKAVTFGEVEWRLERRRYVIRPDTLLLLPDGDEYSMTIDSAELSRTFCPVFRHGLVEDAWRVLVSSDETLLESPQNNRSLTFERRWMPRSGSLGQALDILATAIAAKEAPAALGWLFEALGTRAAQAICEQRGECLRLPSRRPATRLEIHRRLTLAQDAVEDDLARPWTLVMMASAAAMAPHHFHRSFRTAFRETPRSWLSRRRAERALALLRTSSQSIVQICLAVGCESASSFSSSFSARFGISPSRVVRPPRLVRRQVLTEAK